MKKFVFCFGALLLIISVLPINLEVSNASLYIFSLLILVAFFEDLQEFDFLGLKGKKSEKKLQELSKKVDKESDPTNSDQIEKEDLKDLQTKNIELMGVDRGNFLALIFEIERLLKIIGKHFYPEQVNEKTSMSKVIILLSKNGYLTDSGVEQLKALKEIRNLIVHGNLLTNEDHKLSEWVDLAARLYSEIYKDISGRNLIA